MAASAGRVPSGPPTRDERGELVRAVLPGEVARLEDVELAVGQPLVEKLAVDRWYHRVLAATDDLQRRPDLRQQAAEGRELGRVRADVAHRLDEPVALVGRQ